MWVFMVVESAHVVIQVRCTYVFLNTPTFVTFVNKRLVKSLQWFYVNQQKKCKAVWE